MTSIKLVLLGVTLGGTMFRSEQAVNKNTIYLEGEITIYQVAELKQQIFAVINDTQELEINLAQVTEIDSAGIQLLMFIKKQRLIFGKPLALTEHSKVVLDLFELMNLVTYFNDPVVLIDSEENNNE
jgi:anti-anti-sigma factor